MLSARLLLPLVVLAAVVGAFWFMSDTIARQRAALDTVARTVVALEAQVATTKAVADATARVASKQRIIVTEAQREAQAFPLVVADDSALLAELGAALGRLRSHAPAAGASDRANGHSETGAARA